MVSGGPPHGGGRRPASASASRHQSRVFLENERSARRERPGDLQSKPTVRPAPRRRRWRNRLPTRRRSSSRTQPQEGSSSTYQHARSVPSSGRLIAELARVGACAGPPLSCWTGSARDHPRGWHAITGQRPSVRPAVRRPGGAGHHQPSCEHRDERGRRCVLASGARERADLGGRRGAPRLAHRGRCRTALP